MLGFLLLLSEYLSLFCHWKHRYTEGNNWGPITLDKHCHHVVLVLNLVIFRDLLDLFLQHPTSGDHLSDQSATNLHNL